MTKKQALDRFEFIHPSIHYAMRAMLSGDLRAYDQQRDAWAFFTLQLRADRKITRRQYATWVNPFGA